MSSNLQDRLDWIVGQLGEMSKKGALVQLSGGVDSSTVLHLAARALGADRVKALYLPDRATGPETKRYVQEAAQSAGVELIERSIAETIEAQFSQDEVADIIRKYEPDYDPQTQAYAVNASPTMARRLGALVYQVVIGPRNGKAEKTLRMSADDLRAIIAYQNRKQRTRMLFAYAEAERLNYAVVGASNGDELRSGFVVKYGDDAADICAIGDCTKEEVYELARELGVPQSIIDRTPTTDTYALEQSQEDYYYALPAGVLTAVVTMSDADLADDASLQPLVDELPGWSVASLRQAAVGLRASLRYLQIRSRVWDHS
ncbi:NAD(+) synthase [Dermatophilus congolensis]|uniref:NH(3)-dependent NAD(+) synthetase n=1 Tax=Dermatophilus congolensis TaxID=1863 RepID=A0AA46H0U4_9MICO|nr:NAD(+) synthase [Dermatophilus congolensis]STD11254.1 Probable NH(3)-dependent NAD(+) synthetase [Dermatophilus congolensis]